MKVFIGGNPLNVREDDTAIYTEPRYMPTPEAYESFPILEKGSVPEIVQHLYYVTMEQNGYTYFYPNIEAGTNLCRYEWHYDFREESYALRVGLCFTVKDGTIEKPGYYIQRHEVYKDISGEYPEFSITEEEYSLIIEFIDSNIKEAAKRLTAEPSKEFYPIHYLELSRPLKSIFSLNEELTLLPSHLIEGKLVTALVTKSEGYSYLASKRVSDENAYIICALFTLVVDHARFLRMNGFPQVSKIAANNHDKLLANVEKFYPNGKSDFSGVSGYLGLEELDNISELYSAYFSIEDHKKKRKLTNLLFSYYSAKEALSLNKTLSLISFVACLDSISKECAPEIRDRDGSRKAIVHHINEVIDGYKIKGDVDKWSKRIYNDHRSSYVHGANIRFEEYSQNMDGKAYAGLPKALPTSSKAVGKQYEYDSDYDTLSKITNVLLLKYVESISGIKLPDKFKEIDFDVESIPEAYFGVVNRGWFKIG